MTTPISSDTNTFASAVAKVTSSTSTATASSKTKSTVMGKEDFLTLLVAQLKNQDPLNPDNPTEFTAQLAQFSSLEQLTNLNTSMEALTAAQGNSDKLAALSLIGKNVAYNSSSFSYDGSSVEIGYQLDGAASSVTLSIQDSTGKIVRTLQGSTTELNAGNHFLTWDGKDTNGNPVASGDYKIVLQASAAGTGSSVAAAPLIRSVVTGVDLSTGMVTTQDGKVLYTDIIGVSDPQTLAATSTNTGSTTDSSSTNTSATTDDQQTSQNSIEQILSQYYQQS